jgi:hypothetical protein
MKTFNLKNKVIVAIATLGFAVSANATNQNSSFEQMVSTYISAQGQQVMQELSGKLQNNIATQLQNFKLDHEITWFENEQSTETAQRSEETTTTTTTED